MSRRVIVKFYPSVGMAANEFCKFLEYNEGHVAKASLKDRTVDMLDGTRVYFSPLREFEDCMHHSGREIHILDFHPGITDRTLINWMRTRLRGMKPIS